MLRRKVVYKTIISGLSKSTGRESGQNGKDRNGGNRKWYTMVYLYDGTVKWWRNMQIRKHWHININSLSSEQLFQKMAKATLKSRIGRNKSSFFFLTNAKMSFGLRQRV